VGFVWPSLGRNQTEEIVLETYQEEKVNPFGDKVNRGGGLKT